MSLADDRELLAAAYREALYAAGNSDPNPAVGAVIADTHGVIRTTGYTQRAGYAHAERKALERATASDLRECSMYVTLEPCCHHGRTPPCTDAILQSQISRVVIAERDFAAEVGGRSVDLLNQNGVAVVLWPKDDFTREKWLTTGPFFFARRHNRPRVLLKWAQTADGSLAPANPSRPSGKISGNDAALLTAILRFYCKLTIAAPGTVLVDSPRLTVRPTAVLPDLSRSGLSRFMRELLRVQYTLLTQERSSDATQQAIRSAERLRLLPENFSPAHAYHDLGELEQYLLATPIAHREWKNDFSSAWNRVLAAVLKHGFNSALLEAGPVFSEQILQKGYADAIVVYRSRTRHDRELWGAPGRKNSASALIAKGQKPQLPGFTLLEFAELDDDDFLLYAKEYND